MTLMGCCLIPGQPGPIGCQPLAESQVMARLSGPPGLVRPGPPKAIFPFPFVYLRQGS